MVKNYNKYIEQESGRSMVEMLGVLAIIGVLSVGGISGYTTAMNKHKANEILNAAAVRAMAVSTQLQSGVTDPTLGEFPSGEQVGGATFGDVEPQGDKFKIAFSLNNDAVLDQIRNIAGTDGIVRKITDGGLIYNNDLTTGERASDFDGDTTNCVEPKYTYCSSTGTCITGANQTESCPADCAALYGENAIADDSEGNTRIGNTGCYCPAGTKFKGGECKAPFVAGSSGCHYCNPDEDCWEWCSEYGNLYQDPATPKTNVCPDGYHWATYSEFFNLVGDADCEYDGDYNHYYNCTYADNPAFQTFINNTGYVWLKDCCSDAADKKKTGVACSAGSGNAWYVLDDGFVASNARGNGIYSELCVL